MRLLHAVLTNPAQFEELKSLLGQNGLGLLDDILVHRVQIPTKSEDRKELVEKEKEKETFYSFYFQPGLQPARQVGYFGFESLSAGTQRVIRILVSLVFDQSTVMLLEHPEDGIHRGLLLKLIDVLQKYADQSQLIVSSHSSVVFDTLNPATIRLVTMGEGKTKIRSLTPAELGAAGKFLEEEGSLSDFLETVEED
jgi:predicted ATPase